MRTVARSLLPLAGPQPPGTAHIMRLVLLAMAPGMLLQTLFLGPAYLINLGVALLTALAVERLVNRARGVSWPGGLGDGSALVTAALVVMAAPPAVSPVIIAAGTALGLLLGKHIYGGLGNNPFNPAMVGYAIILISFPETMAHWPAPPGTGVDALSGATALEVMNHRDGITVADLYQQSPLLGQLGGAYWEWINLAYAAGGVFLIWRRLIDWRIPAMLLGTLGLLSALYYDSGSSASLGSPSFHWLSGGIMLAAFFVATDPVSSPTQRQARLIYAALIGSLIFVIRSWGAYPDGIAFAILLANACTPALDRLVRRNATAGQIAPQAGGQIRTQSSDEDVR